MLQVLMDPDVIKGLGPLADQVTHSKAVAYFEQAKSTNQGLEFCATALTQELYKEDYVNFFLWQVMEHQVKHRYSDLPNEIKLGVKSTLLSWLVKCRKLSTNQLPDFLRNKAAQIFALVFSQAFLSEWMTFMQDIMLASLGESETNNSNLDMGTNMYLKILLAIDSEVVDRNIDYTAEEQTHNQLLKDTMRVRCVQEMVNSWNYILSFVGASDENKSLCLQVVGAYVTWIDITLIANDRFMPLILNCLNQTNLSSARESACDCIREIAVKGMLPLDKLALIDSLWATLQSSNLLTVSYDNDDIDFVIKLSRLVSSMTSTLIFAWNKLYKTKSDDSSQDKTIQLLTSSVHIRLPTCLQFFQHDDDDVSAQCIDLLRDYLDMLKRTQPLNEDKEDLILKLFSAIVKKLKYDEEYRFFNEGEEEAEFQEYLKSVKVIYDNLTMLCPQLVLRNVQSLLSSTLTQWQALKFNDVEVAIRLLYMLGESIPSNMSTQFSPDKNKTSPLHDMMTLLVISGVSNHPHSAVRLQFFETVARYDRFFPAAAAAAAASGNQQPSVVATTTQAFFDHRGLRSDDPKLRSRCAYLMSRYVKTLGKLLSSYAEEILVQIQDLLVLSPVDGVERFLSNDDQLFIYELCGNLIVNSNFSSEKKAALMTALLRPLVEEFHPLLMKMRSIVAEEEQLPADQRINGTMSSELYAVTLNYMMSYASRTSKAFSNKQTMSQSGCAPIYTDALKVFLQALDTEAHRSILHTGVRQYLHRMVICLEEEVLPFVPLTIRHLLSNRESKSLHDFIPLLNQVVNKFKKMIEPFLREVFMLVVRAVFDVLSRANDNQSADDIKIIRRTYFQFLLALVTNNVVSVIFLQAQPDLRLVLSTLIEGAVESRDAAAQKTCFTVLTKLVQSWESDIGIPLSEFSRANLVPACFMAPLRDTFDLKDAQTVLALNESSSLMKAIHKKQGDELENFLRQYLPTLNLSQERIEEYCRALRVSDNKNFRNYIKAFFGQAKT